MLVSICLCVLDIAEGAAVAARLPITVWTPAFHPLGYVPKGEPAGSHGESVSVVLMHYFAFLTAVNEGLDNEPSCVWLGELALKQPISLGEAQWLAGGSLILIPSETSPAESPWTLTQTGISAVLTTGGHGIQLTGS